MRIISRKTIRDFSDKHPDAATPLDDWFNVVRRADWASPHETKAQFGNASIVRECVVFNIGGNKFRLVVWINYEYKVVYVKSVLTHADYDDTKIDCRNS